MRTMIEKHNKTKHGTMRENDKVSPVASWNNMSASGLSQKALSVHNDFNNSVF